MRTILSVMILSLAAAGAVSETSRGLQVECENRCAPYDGKAYNCNDTLDQSTLKPWATPSPPDGMLDRAYPSPYVEGIAFRSLQGHGH